jgi:hypothetical protein
MKTAQVQFFNSLPVFILLLNLESSSDTRLFANYSRFSRGLTLASYFPESIHSAASRTKVQNRCEAKAAFARSFCAVECMRDEFPRPLDLLHASSLTG